VGAITVAKSTDRLEFILIYSTFLTCNFTFDFIRLYRQRRWSANDACDWQRRWSANDGRAAAEELFLLFFLLDVLTYYLWSLWLIAEEPLGSRRDFFRAFLSCLRRRRAATELDDVSPRLLRCCCRRQEGRGSERDKD